VPCRPNVISAGPSVSTVLHEKFADESRPFPSDSPYGDLLSLAGVPPDAASASSSIYLRFGFRCLFPPTGSPVGQSASYVRYG
jgi:hypothetical protein